MSRRQIPMPNDRQVGRAIRLTYVQVMCTAIFMASTGGMFLVGFAIELGANDVWLGAMAGIPQFFVIFQFVAAYFVERGVSRKWITASFAFLSAVGWFLVAVIPFYADAMSANGRLAILTGIMALVTVAWHFMVNARSSWIGELVPAHRRGHFFGYCTLFAGIIGSVFAIVEGRFLDVIRSYGLFAFAGLFFFGSAFGLASAALHIPQPECPLPGEGTRTSFWQLVRDTFGNRPFVMLALVSAVLAMSGIAGPFTAAYCLRDLGVSFFGLGLLNCVFTASMLLCSPFWGRLVDKIGSRPIVIVSLLIMAPCSIAWLFIPPKSPRAAYFLLPWVNLLAGLGSGGLIVAMASLRYKLSAPQGRSVQFAVLDTFMALLGAPMPILGGWLVSRLQAAGHAVDLRLTFYLWSGFVLAAAVLARLLREPESMRTRTLVFSYFPGRVARLWGYIASAYPFANSIFRPTEASRDVQPLDDEGEPR